MKIGKYLFPVFDSSSMPTRSNKELLGKQVDNRALCCYVCFSYRNEKSCFPESRNQMTAGSIFSY